MNRALIRMARPTVRIPQTRWLERPTILDASSEESLTT